MESLTFFREFPREPGGDVLFRAEVRGGVAVLTYVDPYVRNDVGKWFAHGLHEYVGPRFEEEPRTTMPDEPEFLGRLKRYIQGQFRFPCEHVVSRCGDPTTARPWQDLPGMRRLMPGVYHAWGDGRRPRCDAVRCAVVRLKDCEVMR